MADGRRVIIRSKPFIASDLGGCGDPPRGLKFTRARGSLRGFNPANPRQFEHCLCITCIYRSIELGDVHETGSYALHSANRTRHHWHCQGMKRLGRARPRWFGDGSSPTGSKAESQWGVGRNHHKLNYILNLCC